MPKILVTGGTGVLGQAVTKLFLSNKTDFIIGSRTDKAKSYGAIKNESYWKEKWIYMDLSKTEELNKSIGKDLNKVLHLASLPLQKIHGQPADTVLTKNLLNLFEKRNIEHIIYVSIVGIDKIPFSYYKSKLESENLIKSSGVPYTILRVVQFHDFIDLIATKLLSSPISLIPKQLKFQPIQIEAVALEIDKIIKKSPSNNTYNIGGRKIYTMEQLVNSLLKIQNKSKLTFNMPVIGKVMHGFANGYNTCENSSLLSNTWEEYLVNKYQK